MSDDGQRRRAMDDYATYAEHRATLRLIADEAEAGLILSPQHQQYALRSILQRAQYALGGGRNTPEEA